MTLFLLTVINDVPTCRSRMESSLMVDWWSPDHRQRREEFRQILDCLSYTVLHVIVSEWPQLAWSGHGPVFRPINPMDCFY
jgi:hypothetical protein